MEQFGGRCYWSPAGEPATDINCLVGRLSHSSLGVVIDRNVPEEVLPSAAFAGAAFVERIEGGERAKTLAEVTRFISAHQGKLDRNSVVVVVGGGATLDLAGLCCGLMYRGIRYVSVPTSLIAIADAAYGGKTAVNHDSKNQIGMYHHPETVYANPTFLESLPDVHLRSGMIEIAKLAVFFDDIRAALEEAQAGRTTVASLALLAARRKLELLADDPFEQDGASVLLYGHPFGNVFEAFAGEDGPEVPHGLAVALGISFSAWISDRLSEPRGRHLTQLALVANWFDPARFASEVTPASGGVLRDFLARDKYASDGMLSVPAVCDRPGYTRVPLDAVSTAYEEWRAWLLSHEAVPRPA